MKRMVTVLAAMSLAFWPGPGTGAANDRNLPPVSNATYYPESTFEGAYRVSAGTSVFQADLQLSNAAWLVGWPPHHGDSERRIRTYRVVFRGRLSHEGRFGPKGAFRQQMLMLRLISADLVGIQE